MNRALSPRNNWDPSSSLGDASHFPLNHLGKKLLDRDKALINGMARVINYLEHTWQPATP